MDSYKYLIDNITVGEHTKPRKELNDEEIERLYQTVKSSFSKLALDKDDRFETDLYYVYVGGFPCNHIAIDNKSGTSRLYSIFSYDDFLKVKPHLQLFK